MPQKICQLRLLQHLYICHMRARNVMEPVDRASSSSWWECKLSCERTKHKYIMTIVQTKEHLHFNSIQQFERKHGTHMYVLITTCFIRCKVIRRYTSHLSVCSKRVTGLQQIRAQITSEVNPPLVSITPPHQHCLTKYTPVWSSTAIKP